MDQSIAQLYLVRHGDTDMNAPGEKRFRAWSDPPLNDKGVQSAHEAGQFLQDKGIAHIFSSDLTRNMQTAKIISQYTGAEVTPTQGLRTWNLGAMTGQLEKTHQKFHDAYRKKTPNTPVPGGESYNDFQSRWQTTLQHLTMFAAKLGKPIALVTHTTNIDNIRKSSKTEQPPGGVVRMDVNNKGRVKFTDLDGSEGMKDERGFQE